jgi:hypothetical protein
MSRCNQMTHDEHWETGKTKRTESNDGKTVETHKVTESKGQAPAKAARRAAQNAGAWLFASTEIFYDWLFLRELGRARNNFQTPFNYWASNYQISEIIQTASVGRANWRRASRLKTTTTLPRGGEASQFSGLALKSCPDSGRTIVMGK